MDPLIVNFRHLLYHLFIVQGALLLATLTQSVKITRFYAPHLFDMSTHSELLLDCDYTYNENDFKLVVRWFHENRPEPIYQWIPEKQIRHVAEHYRSSFDLNYTADANDPYTKYRAINIKRPHPSMSGKYTCDISSLAGQDSQQRVVFIYASPKVFDFSSKFKEESGNLELDCKVENVYPIPILTISQQVNQGEDVITVESLFNSISQQDVNSETTSINNNDHQTNQNRSIERKKDSPLFDVSVKHVINKENLLRTASSRSETIFQCNIEIPNTNYRKSKKITLYSNKSTSSSSTSAQTCTLIAWCLFNFISHKLMVK